MVNKKPLQMDLKEFNGGITSKLLPQQVRMVKFAAKRNFVGLFGDYGVGKTLAGLAIICMFRMRYVLIVSTKTSIESTWPTEIRKHTRLRFYQLQGTRKRKLEILKLGLKSSYRNKDLYYDRRNGCAHTVVFLINYEGVANIAEELAEVKFDGMFLDESRKIKTHDIKRTITIWAIGWTCKFRALLTGFPLSEGLHELYSQIKFLDGGKALGNSYYKYEHENFAHQGPYLVPKRTTLKKILKAISPFCLRITNKYLKLPPAVERTIEVKKTPQQMAAIKELHDYFQLEFGKVKIDTQYILTLVSRELQICDGFVEDIPPKDKHGRPTRKPKRELMDTAKDDALLDLLDEIDARKNKVVIWANHRFAVRKIVTLLEKFYKKTRVKVLELSGRTEDAQQVVNKFQHTKDHNIIVCSIKKAAESITLTESRYNIRYGHLWSYDLHDNANARTRRIGSEKHKNIVYINIVTKGTVEKNVVSCLARKANLIKELKEQFKKLKGKEIE